MQGKENVSNYDRFQSNSKYGAKSPMSDNRSFMTGQKNQNSAMRHLAITDRKRDNSGMKPFSQNQNVSNVKSNGAHQAKRKTVVFKQTSNKFTESVYDQDTNYQES